MNATIHSILKKYWGFPVFRPLQQEIIEAVLRKEDVLALLPTGGGKSLCFQVPALAQEGLCLVVSPLIALIKDQVENLQEKGIPALAIYSGMNYHEVIKALKNASFGNYKFLYLSPERLQTALFQEYLPALQPSLIAIDEAHCISQWGYDFRPSYLKIAEIRKQLPGVPIIALTASATPAVQDDICEKLEFTASSHKFSQSFARPNISYSVFLPSARQSKLVEILEKVNGTSIVYCKSRKQTQQVASLLSMHGFGAEYYHAGLSTAERTSRQDSWIQNKTRVMVCTNAFGMGIDKPDVRSVIHFDVPDCMENYYQEAGRAGRDGKRSYAVLLYEKKDPEKMLSRIEQRYPAFEAVKKVYIALMNHLQVAAGSGEGMSYNLDLAIFCRNFSLDVVEATNAIQILALQGILSFNETSFQPSTVEFTINKTDLLEFENIHEALSVVIKGLLRSYEGIFDYPTVISERMLAAFTKMPVQDIFEALKKLHHHGVIRYKQSDSSPIVYLIKNRMYRDDFWFDEKTVAKQRKQAELRAALMIKYLEEKTKCRNLFISGYFGESEGKPCGICDNCIDQKKLANTAGEFDKVSEKVISILKINACNVDDLFKQLQTVDEKKLWEVVNYLIAEDLVVADRLQRLHVKKCN